MDRRAFLERTGRAALAAGLLSAAPEWLARAAAAPSDPALRELARSIAGTVVGAGDPGYEQARLLQSTRFDGIRPRAIVFCETPDDVARTLHWTRRHGLPLAVRAGGHSYGGYSTTAGGIVIDVTRMSRVRVAAGKSSATIGAGALLVDVYSGLLRHGLTIPAGSCPSVGLAGLALGGGYGYASRKLGLTWDRLTSIELVTAAGERLRCDESQHADLFWACRGGGGGNFGVATSFGFAAAPVTSVATYSIEWPWSQAVEAVQAWQTFAPHAPDGLTAVCDLLATDPAANARAHVVSAGQLFGSEAELQALIEPLASAGTPLRVATKSRSYADAILEWSGCGGRTARECHPAPRGTLARTTFRAKSDYVARPLSRAAIRRLVAAVAQRQASAQLGRGSILLDAYGGAINRVDPGATAFVHRRQLFSIQYVAQWPLGSPAARTRANLAWLQSVHAALRPDVSGQAYQNYVDPGLAGWAHAYYGADLRLLRAVKRRYDPASVFRFPQGLPG